MRSAEYEISHSVSRPPSTRSFPFFLRLPREIRDLIYADALIHADPDVYLTGRQVELVNERILYMHHPSWDRVDSMAYWGTGKSSRLFRVNRQFSAELREVFYSTFTLSFRLRCQYHTLDILDGVLRDRYHLDNMVDAFKRAPSIWAGNSISRMELKLLISCKPNPRRFGEPARRPESSKVALALGAAMKWLPSLRHVDLILGLYGLPVYDEYVKEIVAYIVEILNPLRHGPNLVIQENKEGSCQGDRILKEVREALDCT